MQACVLSVVLWQDVVRRYKETHTDFEAFPDKVAFQLNDTHPTIAVAELMRVLMDENKLGWTKSWDITTKVPAPYFHKSLKPISNWPAVHCVAMDLLHH